MLSDKKTIQKIVVTVCILLMIIVIMLLLFNNRSDGRDNSDNQAGASNEALEDSSNISSEGSTDSETFAHITGNSQDMEQSVSGNSVDDSGKYQKVRNDISGNSLYESETARVKKAGITANTDIAVNEENIRAQLKELSEYWVGGNMDAVRELVHSERFESVTADMSGTDIYYYGDSNSQKLAEGTGIAVYAKDQYYYGSWVNGCRSGEGTWFSFYPENDTGTVDEHMYSGSWENDLPNGHGQENFVYDTTKMDEISFYRQNVIGNFHDGKYNGEMYVITQDRDSATVEWYGTCENGVWKMLGERDDMKYAPVLYQADNKDHYIWMPDDANKNYGVEGLISVRLL